jgi:hypothetical protein
MSGIIRLTLKCDKMSARGNAGQAVQRAEKTGVQRRSKSGKAQTGSKVENPSRELEAE